MEKLTIVFIFGPILMNMLAPHAEAQRPNSDESGRFLGKERVTRLQFYLQDVVGGENRTVWPVAESNLTDILPSAFGRVCLLDNLVTSGPEFDSKKLGRMQGLIGLSDFHEMALVMLLNIVFTEGEYKGSTLSILGRNPLRDKIREVPIVGGTGAFRMARGYVITRTCSSDERGILNVYEYNVVVRHMDDVIM